MTSVQIDCFLEVAKLNSFSRAADNLFMSQPTLSRYILSLEEELCVTLFIRSKNTVHLSEIGRALLPKFEAYKQNRLSENLEIQNEINRYSRRLRIGVQTGQIITPSLASELSRLQNMNCNVVLRALDLKTSYQEIINGNIDLLIYTSSTFHFPKEINTRILFEDQMCLAVPASQHNAGLPYIALDEIPDRFPDLPLFLIRFNKMEIPEEDFEFEDIFKKMERTGHAHYIEDSISPLSNILLKLQAGLGMIIINQHSVAKDDSNVRLLPLCYPESKENKFMKATINIAWVRNNTSAMLKEFLQNLIPQLPLA